MTASQALLLSIALHVAWNLLARHVPARQQFIWWALLGHLVLFGPWAVYGLLRDARWDASLLACIGISGAALSVYFIGLRLAYRHAPVALAYPIARSAPLFIALLSWLAFGETFNTMGVTGILVSTVALFLLAATAWRIDARHALAPAFMATLGTTVYSLSDKIAVTRLPTFVSQIGYITLGYLLAWLALSLALRLESGHWLPKAHPPLPLLAAGALSIGLAYALIVYAMTSLPAAYAVALSNGGIFIAVLLSIFWFGEKEHRWGRLLWSCLLVSGLLMVASAR